MFTHFFSPDKPVSRMTQHSQTFSLTKILVFNPEHLSHRRESETEKNYTTIKISTVYVVLYTELSSIVDGFSHTHIKYNSVILIASVQTKMKED